MRSYWIQGALTPPTGFPGRGGDTQAPHEGWLKVEVPDHRVRTLCGTAEVGGSKGGVSASGHLDFAFLAFVTVRKEFLVFKVT